MDLINLRYNLSKEIDKNQKIKTIILDYPEIDLDSIKKIIDARTNYYKGDVSPYIINGILRKKYPSVSFIDLNISKLQWEKNDIEKLIDNGEKFSGEIKQLKSATVRYLSNNIIVPSCLEGLKLKGKERKNHNKSCFICCDYIMNLPVMKNYKRKANLKKCKKCTVTWNETFPKLLNKEELLRQMEQLEHQIKVQRDNKETLTTQGTLKKIDDYNSNLLEIICLICKYPIEIVIKINNHVHPVIIQYEDKSISFEDIKPLMK